MNTMTRGVTGHRPHALIAVILLTALALGACGPRGGLSDRYVAERLAWQAQKLRRAMRENPELATDAMKDRLSVIYREIVRRFPPPTMPAESLTDTERDVAAVAGLSRMRLAAMSAEAGDVGEAVRLYSSVADSYSFDRGIAVEASIALAATHDGLGQREEAKAILERIVEEWPPAEPRDAAADLRVVAIPLRIATSHLLHGDEANAPEAFRRARDYYRGLVSAWAGTPTEAAALGLLAESFELEGRWSEAAEIYEEYDRTLGSTENRASLWLKLGELHGSRLGNRALASQYYRSVEEQYSDEPEGGSASITLATYDIEAEMYAEARARLESVLDRFPDDETLAAPSLQRLAISYELEGHWDSAVAQYNALAAQYPATVYGLSAPMHIAMRYEEMGESRAAQTALERAAEHYARVARDYAATPAELAARNYVIAVRTMQERWPEVAQALVETAGRYPDSTVAPSMLVRAAEIHDVELGDPGRARELLQRVVLEHPETAAAQEARRRLEELDQR
jgi:TolA-binding protein